MAGVPLAGGPLSGVPLAGGPLAGVPLAGRLFTTHSHHAITGLSLQSSFLTNFLPEEPLKQLGDLTNVPYMIKGLRLHGRSEGCGMGAQKGYTVPEIRTHSYCRHSQLGRFQTRPYIFTLRLWINRLTIFHRCLQGMRDRPPLS